MCNIKTKEEKKKRGKRKAAEETHSTSTNITFLQLPKPISVSTSLIHFSKRNVHEIVAVDEMSVEGFTVFELHQLYNVVCIDGHYGFF